MPQRWWTRLLLGLAVVIVLLGAAAGWLAYSGLKARSALETAKTALQRTQSQLTAGDTSAAKASLGQAQRAAARAHSLTTGPVWWAAARLPLAGSSVTTVRVIAAASDDLSSRVLPGLVGVADSIDPANLRTGPEAVNLAPLVAAEQPLATALDRAKAVQAALVAAPATGEPTVIVSARTQLLDAVDTLVSDLRTVHTASQVLPVALGAHGPTRWLLVLQTPAEARGTGGVPGGVVVLLADHGKITVEKLGTDKLFTNTKQVDAGLPDSYLRRWAPWTPTTLFVNGGVSPNFPYAAQIWATQWQTISSEHVDGVATMDPFVLADLLSVVGPVTLPDGTRVTGANAADFVLKTQYARYPSPGPTDQLARKAMLESLLHQVLDRVLGYHGSMRALLGALGKGISAGRILAAMPGEPQTQAILAGLPLGGALPPPSQPFLGIALNDAGGSKLDTYLTRQVSVVTRSCPSARTSTTATLTLGNTAPASGLPAYVTIRADKKAGTYPPGQRRDYLSFYAGGNAHFLSVSVDGKATTVESTVEDGHPVVSLFLLSDPGARHVITVKLSEPSGSVLQSVWLQPLVNAPKVTISHSTC